MTTPFKSHHDLYLRKCQVQFEDPPHLYPGVIKEVVIGRRGEVIGVYVKYNEDGSVEKCNWPDDNIILEDKVEFLKGGTCNGENITPTSKKRGRDDQHQIVKSEYREK